VLDRNHDRVPRIHDRVEGLKAGEHGRGGVLISKTIVEQPAGILLKTEIDILVVGLKSSILK